VFRDAESEQGHPASQEAGERWNLYGNILKNNASRINTVGPANEMSDSTDLEDTGKSMQIFAIKVTAGGLEEKKFWQQKLPD